MVPVYALYCEELPDRKRALVEHLSERGVPHTLYRSFHGKTWGLETRLEYDEGKRISPGHVGLCVGFYSLCQHIKLSCPADTDHWGPGGRTGGDDSFIIFEDDVEVPEGFWDRLQELQVDLDRDFPDWDLVFLGLAEVDVHVWGKISERIGLPDSRLCRMDSPFGTHAIMMRRRALPVILEKMTVAQRNLDQQLWDRVLKPGHLKWCAVLPSIVRQRTFDYEGKGTPQWGPSCVDKLPVDPRLLNPPAQVDPPGKARPELVSATAAIVDPFSCAYRGEYLDDHGYGPKNKAVPLALCAKLNLPCHNKTFPVAVGRGVDARLAVACKDCGHRSEIRRDKVRPRLPVPEGHFNPSIHLWRGRVVLATRDSWGHSKVALWWMDNTHADWTGEWKVTPIGSYGSSHPDAPRLADPRLFVAPHPVTRVPHLHAMFSLPDGYPPKKVQVGYARFCEDLSGIEETVVMRSPFDNAYEKNWMPIWDDEAHELRWVYSYKPEHIVMGGTQTWRTANKLPWSAGVIRGGATPVLADIRKDFSDWKPRDFRGGYYHFFHGCMKKFKGNVYSTGCMVFEAQPPYRVLRQTPVPLLWPDQPGPGEDVTKRMVVWPGGAIPHAGAWHVVHGVDDTFCKMVRFTFEEVENALSDVPEETTSVSLRDTPMATGSR